MNYIELFKKVAYLDKPINYFRGLPDEEGMLFREMYAWMVSQGKPKYFIHSVFCKIRACYLGILFEDKENEDAAAGFCYYDLSQEEKVLIATYFRSVVDPTTFGELKIIADSLIDKYVFCNPMAYFGMSENLMKYVRGENNKFQSSFTPEIDGLCFGHVEKNIPLPSRWDYWKDCHGNSVFNEYKLFMDEDFEEAKFVVRLMSDKIWKLTACDALEKAIKEGYRTWNK